MPSRSGWKKLESGKFPGRNWDHASPTDSEGERVRTTVAPDTESLTCDLLGWTAFVGCRQSTRHSEGLTMRQFRRIALIWLLMVGLCVPTINSQIQKCVVFIGTYTGGGSEGIYSFRFDPASGEMSPLTLAAATVNPSFLAPDPDGRFLYAVNELDSFQGAPTGAVSAFYINRESGGLKLLQQVSSVGQGPAHLSLDRSGRNLLVANYGGGNVSVLPIGDDGRLGAHSAFVQNVGSSVNAKRQSGPHAHFIQTTIDNRFALIADLGLDKVLVYRFDPGAGTLTAANPGFVRVDPGSGPRHIAFAPSGKFAYLVNEMTSTITVFAYDSVSGALNARQTVSTLPLDFTGSNSAAEILVDAGGMFVYVSNRGDNSIGQYSINPDSGTLTAVEWVPSGGNSPRNFAIDPTGRWLFVANQRSDELRLFRIDPVSGRISPTPRSLKVISPVCVSFVVVK